MAFRVSIAAGRGRKAAWARSRVIFCFAWRHGGGSMNNMRRLTDDEVVRILGPLDVLRRDMDEFKENARLFAASHTRFIGEYPQQWIAMIGGEVVVSADRFEDVMDDLDARSLPRSRALVRFIYKNAPTMIV